MNLKNLVLLLLFFIFACAFSLQAQSEKDSAELVLELKVYPSYAIGYANCFKGVVQKVIKGEMPDTVLSMTVVAGDKEHEDIFFDNKGKVFEIGFKKYRTNEKYSHTYITGFVDAGRTSWEIIYIK
jgi:hypothetical protein